MQNWRSQNSEKTFIWVSEKLTAAGQWKTLWKSQNVLFCEGLKKLSNDYFEFSTKEPQAKQEQEQELCSFLEIIRRLQNWWISCLFRVQVSASQIWWLWHLWELLELVLKSNLLKEAPKRESFTHLSRSGMKIKESIPEKHQQGAKWWGQEIHVPLEPETAAGTSLGEAWVFYSLQNSEFWEKQRINSSPFLQDTWSIHCRMIKNLRNGFPADHRH